MNTFSDGMKRVLQRHPARSAAETRELGVAFRDAQREVCAVLGRLGYPLGRIAAELKAGRLGYFREGSDRDRKGGGERKAAYRFAGFTPSHVEEFGREEARRLAERRPPEEGARWQAAFLMRFTFDAIEQVALRARPAPAAAGDGGEGRPGAEDLLRPLEAALAEAHRLRGEILTGNLLLVAKIAIARSRCHRTAVMDDLFAAGTDGLMIAVGRYDPDIGLFSTYATPWIAMAIDRFVAKTSHVIRIPIGLHDRIRRERAAPEGPGEGRAALFSVPEVRSLEESLPGRAGDELRLEDVIADAPASQPREAAERSDISGILHERLGRLDGLKQLILAMRNDIGDAAAVGARLFREEIVLSQARGRAIAAAALGIADPPARILVVEWPPCPEGGAALPEADYAIAV